MEQALVDAIDRRGAPGGGEWILTAAELVHETDKDAPVVFELAGMRDLDIWGHDYQDVSFEYGGRTHHPTGLDGEFSVNLLLAYEALHPPAYPGGSTCWFCRQDQGNSETDLVVEMDKPEGVDYQPSANGRSGEVTVAFSETSVTVPRCPRCHHIHEWRRGLGMTFLVCLLVGLPCLYFGLTWGLESVSAGETIVNDPSPLIPPRHFPLLAVLSLGVLAGLIVVFVWRLVGYRRLAGQWPTRSEERIGTFPLIRQLWEQGFRLPAPPPPD